MVPILIHLTRTYRQRTSDMLMDKFLESHRLSASPSSEQQQLQFTAYNGTTKSTQDLEKSKSKDHSQRCINKAEK